ncbi:ATPase [Desulfovirgula thermocuniculi]|uniref:ATPase n=1 Tax=Desulfovirgula thermocuniculi TaxID=348842 RepID=UPI0004211101|nr:ATPase [Desulfovirgula thermocuniculi]
MEKIREALQEFAQYYHRRLGESQAIEQQLREAERRRGEVAAELELLEKVRLLLQEASDYAREQARQQVEYMVTQALQVVFGPEVEFRVEVAQRRGQPEAEFYVVSRYGGVEVKSRPQDARGGGVVDVISLALRVALLETARPSIGGPLVLDEPGKHLSEEFAPSLAHFLKTIATSFNRQVIMVTHNHHLAEAADLAYSIDLRQGQSVVKKIFEGGGRNSGPGVE